MKKRGIIGSGLLFLCFIICGQAIPRDTSYTLENTLIKILKNNQEVNPTPVYPNPSKKILVEKDITYKHVNQRILVANVFYPRKQVSGGYPGLLLIHGGGWRTGDKTLMTPLAEAIAVNGYVVVVPEYRLSLEARYPAAVEDLMDAIYWIRNNGVTYHLDTATIAVGGCSAGGQLAALVGATSYKNLYNSKLKDFRSSAIIDVDGILAFHHQESEEGEMAAQWLGGTYEEAKASWKEASALTHVDKTTPPVLFIASEYPRFLAGREDVIKKLDGASIYSETQHFENAPHSFWLFNPWFQPTADYIIQFLDKTLKNKG